MPAIETALDNTPDDTTKYNYVPYEVCTDEACRRLHNATRSNKADSSDPLVLLRASLILGFNDSSMLGASRNRTSAMPSTFMSNESLASSYT